jgi:hypothetical protein
VVSAEQVVFGARPLPHEIFTILPRVPRHDDRVRAWILLGLAAGCWHEVYVPLPGSLGGSVARYGCVELSVRGEWRREAEGPVVVIGLGNTCEHSVVIDLGALVVVGVGDSGAGIAMAPYDPDREIRPRRIDARRMGEEWIEFHPVSSTGHLAWLDVDASRVVEGAGAQSRWVRIAVQAL